MSSPAHLFFAGQGVEGQACSRLAAQNWGPGCGLLLPAT